MCPEQKPESWLSLGTYVQKEIWSAWVGREKGKE
jgi:hypothetical protein